MEHENPPFSLHTRGDRGRRASASPVIQYPFDFLWEDEIGMIIGSFKKQNFKPCHTMLYIVSYRVENLPMRALVKANRVNIQPKIGYLKIGCVFSKWVKGKALCYFPGGDKIIGAEPGSIYLNLRLHVIVWQKDRITTLSIPVANHSNPKSSKLYMGCIELCRIQPKVWPPHWLTSVPPKFFKMEPNAERLVEF